MESEEYTLKLGDVLRSRYTGEEGEITVLDLPGPEWHGTIELKITNPGRSTYLKVGFLEHYSYENWQKHMKLVSKA